VSQIETTRVAQFFPWAWLEKMEVPEIFWLVMFAVSKCNRCHYIEQYEVHVFQAYSTKRRKKTAVL